MSEITEECIQNSNKHINHGFQDCEITLHFQRALLKHQCQAMEMKFKFS